MLINNVHIIGKKDGPSQIEISGSKITAVRPQSRKQIDQRGESVINFTDAIAFPGLINSHDHLEFNLYPQLGNKIYSDYVEWGNDIHEKNKEQIEIVKQVPYDLRFKWGLYKNLLCGITTVAHHGNGKVIHFNNLPDVITSYNYLHSIRLEKNWKLKLNLIFNRKPFVVHIGEGTNVESYDEINELLKWNIFKKRIIGIHGISLDKKQSSKITALIWCPDSNFYLYGKTADIPLLKLNTVILFGTDSAVSADWNFWSQLKSARELNYLSDDELYKSVTENAANIWGINSKGSLSENFTADIIISKKKFPDVWDSFYSTNPEDIYLILKNGKIVFIDEELAEDGELIDINNFDLISINSKQKFVIKGIVDLMKSVYHFLPQFNFPVTMV
jgi:cytosine/adenosine deaminase-related metal-dependent hydrolase